MAIEIQHYVKTQLDEPRMYRVYMINDDYTSWEFCLRIIMRVFHKTLEEADNITNDIHTKGKGLCGVYAFEIAETKAELVEVAARNESFPMKCSVEEV
jgi:ATP-dependent Clp protease adaptor protein ClpS